MKVDDIVETVNGKKLQTATIADKSGTVKIVLWGDDVNSLSLAKCYKFEKLVVKEFRGETQLSVSNSKIMEIDEIDDVNLAENKYAPQMLTIEDARIVGVQLFETCLKCRPYGNEGEFEGEFDTCIRCGLL